MPLDLVMKKQKAFKLVSNITQEYNLVLKSREKTDKETNMYIDGMHVPPIKDDKKIKYLNFEFKFRVRHHFHNPKHPSVLPFLSHFTSSLTMRTDSDDDSDFVSPSTLVGGGNVRRVDIINESDGDFEKAKWLG